MARRPRTKQPSFFDQDVGLRAQRRHLEAQLEEAEYVMQRSHAAQLPFANAFWEAHRALESLHTKRDAGQPISKAELFAAYDARLHAGHAWYPSKTAFDDMQRWHRAVTRDLNAVREQIGK